MTAISDRASYATGWAECAKRCGRADVIDEIGTPFYISEMEEVLCTMEAAEELAETKSWQERALRAERQVMMLRRVIAGEPHYLWSHPREAPRVCRPSEATFAAGEPDWVRQYPVNVWTAPRGERA